MSMTRTARIVLAFALVLALALPAAAATVRAPKSGSVYRGGAPAYAELRISGRSVEIVAFNFQCGDLLGRTSLNDFRIKRTDRGYRFNADANALVTYIDETDENAAVHISGRFTLKAHKVRGHFRVKSKRCGDTGNRDWRATRR